MGKRKVGINKKDKVAENTEKTDSVRVHRTRTATKEEGIVAGKAKGKKPMAEKGKLAIGSGVGKVEKSGKRKVGEEEKNLGKGKYEMDPEVGKIEKTGRRKMAAEGKSQEKGNFATDSGVGKIEKTGKRKVTAEEKHQEKSGTSAKRVRNDEQHEKEKKDLGGSGIGLRPRNERVGYKSVNVKAKGGKLKRKLVGEEEDAEKGKTPMKRRKADDGITEMDVSAIEGSYSLRARKGSFKKVGVREDGFAEVVGKRVKVFSSSSKNWKIGKIESLNKRKKLHKVLYDNGESEYVDLKSQRFEIEVLPGEASALSSKKDPNAGKKQIEEKNSKPIRKGLRIARESESNLEQKEKNVEKKVKHSKGKEKASNEDMEEKNSKPTRKGLRRATRESESKLEQRKKTVEKKVNQSKGKEKVTNEDKEENDKEMDGDDEMLISHFAKKSGRLGDVKPVEKKEKPTKKLESKKRVSKRVSEAEASKKNTEKDGAQVSVKGRKNPVRKGRTNAKHRN